MSTPVETLGEAPKREPAINAPWTVAALILALIGAHGLRVISGGAPETFALTSTDLVSERFAGLVTYQFVHGGWTHVLMNAAFILAFGAPVARYLGGGWRGATAFFCFFLVCGAVAAAVYGGYADLTGGLWGQRGGWVLLGASGSASGLMGAAARLLEGRGRPGSMFGRTAATMTLSWIAVNVLLGATGLTPGAAGAPVAWEAHIFGYFCGLLLIGPIGRVAGLKNDHAIAL